MTNLCPTIRWQLRLMSTDLRFVLNQLQTDIGANKLLIYDWWFMMVITLFVIFCWFSLLALGVSFQVEKVKPNSDRLELIFLTYFHTLKRLFNLGCDWKYYCGVTAIGKSVIPPEREPNLKMKAESTEILSLSQGLIRCRWHFGSKPTKLAFLFWSLAKT